MDSVTSTLLSRIEEHCRTHGIAETTFGRMAANDGKIVPRLRAGGTVTLKTAERISDFIGRAHSEAAQ
mgnify:CR=1 FL=1|jgi:hypothetical protein